MGVDLTLEEMRWAVQRMHHDSEAADGLLRRSATEFCQFWWTCSGSSLDCMNSAIDNEALAYRSVLIPELVTQRIT